MPPFEGSVREAVPKARLIWATFRGKCEQISPNNRWREGHSRSSKQRTPKNSPTLIEKMQQEEQLVNRGQCKTFEERKELMKQALASALRAEDMLIMFMDDPMYAEVLEDMRVANEREGRDERSKKHKENILGMVQAVISIRENMVTIRDTKTSRRVYMEAWGEIAVSVCRFCFARVIFHMRDHSMIGCHLNKAGPARGA